MSSYPFLLKKRMFFWVLDNQHYNRYACFHLPDKMIFLRIEVKIILFQRFTIQDFYVLLCRASVSSKETDVFI